MANRKTIGITLTVLALTAAGYAVTPRSASYSFEYVAVGMGGGISESAAYQLTAYADESGSAGKAESSNYSIEPVVGAASDTGNASVSAWSLYE